MATDFSNTGVIRVDGQWATSVRYAVFTTDQGAPKDIELRFLNGDVQVASARLSNQETRDLLGERNYNAIGQVVTSTDRPVSKDPINGQLQGQSLQFSDIKLPKKRTEPDNTVTQAGREKDDSAPEPKPGHPQGAEPSSHGADEPDSDRKAARAGSVPPAIAERFLRIDNKYYFPDRTLAFVDRGTKLKASTHNREVIRSLVAIAQARGWDALAVSGTEEFRREVWREASLHGIEVSGHKPTEIEQLQLQRTLSTERRKQGLEREPLEEQTPDATKPPGQRTKSNRDPSQQPSERIRGRLLDHGAAPYKFDTKGRLSYFVKLETDDGERVLWGVDLERALVESQSGVGIGDTAVVESRGAQRVKVKLPKRDAEGNLIGDEVVEKRRNSWRIEKPAWYERQAAKADAIREEATPKRDLVKEHPDLTHAVVALWLGEQLASKAIERKDDRARVMALLRKTVADAVERGDAIHVPMLKEDVARALDREQTRPTYPPRARAPQGPRAPAQRHLGEQVPTRE